MILGFSYEIRVLYNKKELFSAVPVSNCFAERRKCRWHLVCTSFCHTRIQTTHSFERTVDFYLLDKLLTPPTIIVPSACRIQTRRTFQIAFSNITKETVFYFHYKNLLILITSIILLKVLSSNLSKFLQIFLIITKFCLLLFILDTFLKFFTSLSFHGSNFSLYLYHFAFS